tara:strand:+ start:16194 stop:16430 length:237 start_codon:yes stop_codon:yes gene_type:complete
MKKKYYKKIEEGFKDIFKTDIQKTTSEHFLNNSQDSLITIVREPLVKHQIIQLAKLCEDVPLNLAVTSSSNVLFIEFW